MIAVGRGRRIGLAVVAAGVLVAGLPASNARAVVSTALCPDVEVVTVRGQGEPAGPGWVMGPIVDTLQQQLPDGVSSYPLPYAAGQDLVANVNEGIGLLVRHLGQKSTQCPGTQYVVIGFSLGALVVGEAFARPASRYPGVVKTAIPKRVDPHLVAAIMLGDARFNSHGPEAAGTFWPGVDALNARPANSFARWGDHVRNICNAQDGICQNILPTQSTELAHQDYVKYRDQLTSYVAGTISTMP